MKQGLDLMTLFWPLLINSPKLKLYQITDNCLKSNLYSVVTLGEWQGNCLIQVDHLDWFHRKGVLSKKAILYHD